MRITIMVRINILLSVLLLIPSTAAAFVTDAQYGKCVRVCERKFQAVHPDDQDCDDALRIIRGDLSKLRAYLRSRKVCSGRHQRECRALKGQVTSSVARLNSLIGTNPDCLELDYDAIHKELWWLDIASSCRGDKAYTDIHDLMAKRLRDLRLITALGTHYELVRQRIRRHPEYKSFWPVCGRGTQPNRDYIWPFLEFLVALESIGDVQSCMATCRPPTQQERTLEDLLGRLPQLEESVKEVSEVIAQVRRARGDRIRQRLVRDFPCPRLDAVAGMVVDMAVSITTLREKSAVLESQEPPGVDAVNDMVRLAVEARRGLDALDLSEVVRICQREEERATSLEAERQRMIRSVMRGGSFSVEAARRFDDLAASGEECQWTTECQIPLRCEDGQCAGAVTLADALPLLQEGEQIGRKARELAIVTAQGLDSESVERLERLSADQRGLRGRLDGVGWPGALETWRRAFVEDLGRQLEATRMDAAEAVSRYGTGRCDHSIEPAACATVVEGLRNAIEDVGDLRNVVGDGDPIRDPTWVRLRVDDLHDLRRRVVQLSGDLETASIPAPVSSRSSLPVPLLGGLALLAAVGAGGLIVLRRRRRS